MAWRGCVGLGIAGRGKEGDWQPPGFEAPAPTQGMAGLCKARLGSAGLGRETTRERNLMLFRPRGESPQWKIIYDHVSQMEVDEVITYQQIQNLIPEAGDGSWRVAVHTAIRALEDNNRRTMANVRGVGYRVAHAIEHASLARRQHRAAKRRMNSAVSKMASARREELTPEQRRKFDTLEANLRAQQDMLARLEKRQERTELRVATTEKDHLALSDKVDALQETLRRHGLLDD